MAAGPRAIRTLEAPVLVYGRDHGLGHAECFDLTEIKHDARGRLRQSFEGRAASL